MKMKNTFKLDQKNPEYIMGVLSPCSEHNLECKVKFFDQLDGNVKVYWSDKRDGKYTEIASAGFDITESPANKLKEFAIQKPWIKMVLDYGTAENGYIEVIHEGQ